MPFANRWLGVALVCVGSVACAGSNKPVRSVAEYDLACPKVEVTKVDKQHYAAAGCGRGAVYVQNCDDGGCRWARMRHGHESEVAGAHGPPVYAPSVQREILPAPPPPTREVIPAPPPAEREVMEAPPPATSGGEAPPAHEGAAPAAPSSSVEGELSEPYAAEVPAQPIAQRVQYAPPAPLVETPPPPPRPTYVWVSGYWWWGNWGWTWVPGYWCPPRPGFVYIGGGWYLTNGWWWYYPGGWAYPGTRVIVHAPAPRRERVVMVRTVRPTPTAHVTPARAVATSPTGRTREVIPAPAPARAVTETRTMQRPRPFSPSASPLTGYPSRSVSATRERASTVPNRSVSATRDNAEVRSSSVGRLVLPRQTVPPRSSYSDASRGGTPSISRDAFQTRSPSRTLTPRSSGPASSSARPSQTPTRSIRATPPPSRSMSRPVQRMPTPSRR